jgi:hypothetical protein
VLSSDWIIIQQFLRPMSTYLCGLLRYILEGLYLMWTVGKYYLVCLILLSDTSVATHIFSVKKVAYTFVHWGSTSGINGQGEHIV